MIEHERSYVFSWEKAQQFLEDHKTEEIVVHIEDHYLCENKRIRKSWIDGGASLTYKFTRKTGEKSKGYRFEFEKDISPEIAESLIKDSVLVVSKKRHKLYVGGSEYMVTMDFVESPMKLAILEIEAVNEVVYPIPADIAHKLFGVSLIECPLSSYNLFKRHLGICGGPSSGKSETGKILSHILNTEYGANSFHVAEFATTFIQKYRMYPTFWKQFLVWHGQHEREYSADSANIVISDCPTFLTYVYLMHLPKDEFSDDTALILSKVYKRVLFDVQWYSDIIFLELQEYTENGVRYQSKDEALDIERRIKGFLDDHNISYRTYNYSQVPEMLRQLWYMND